MNPQIKQLALQAKQYAHDNEDPDERTSWDFLFETKFAELILGRCVETLKVKGETYGAYLIEKDFGVTDENL